MANRTSKLDPNRGVEARSLRFLEDVLWEWVAVQERSVRLWRRWPDVPWWYGERASISHLAGAIWRAGGVALEEFAAEKRREKGPSGRRLALGRGDLAFTLGARDFTIEAKQCWPNIRGVRSRQRIEATLAGAVADARSTKIATREKSVAVVFAVPYATSSGERNMDDLIKSWVSMLRTVPCDAVAWAFPQRARFTFWERDRLCYPGIGMLLRAL